MLNININAKISPIQKNENEINDNDMKIYLFNLINQIITGTFISSKKNTNDAYSVINTKYYQFKQYYVYNQNRGSLCGFHSLLNIYYFLQYLTSEENDKNKSLYLFNLKNSWCFWSFYKEALNFLLNNYPLEKKAIESLVKGGPLERYQFIYLLKEFPKMKNLFDNINNKNYIISFTKFLYGFGIFNGSTDEVLDFQEKINNFNMEEKNNKEKILIILLGIVNHWNILILHKDKDNKKNIYFLDSRNYPEIFDPFELFDQGFNEDNNIELKNMKESFVTKELNRRFSKSTYWSITCLKDWYDSMNKSFIIIFKMLDKKLNLHNYIIQNKIDIFVNTFVEKTNIDINNKINDINGDDINKIWKWIIEDYHPALFNDIILNDIRISKTKIKEIRFINWVYVMDIFLNKENNNKEINEDKKELVLRYIKLIDELRQYIDFS